VARFKTIAGPTGSVQVQFTAEEEAAKDAEETKWNNAEPARKWSAIRAQRDQLLAASDWMANSDVTMPDAWTTYRQALRNLPASQSDPDDIVFPEEPS
jgi:hypothetical protein